MKSFFKSVLLIASISIFTLTSCQNEDTQISTDDSANLTNTSALTGLLSRVSQDSTSIDNVIDSTSCFSVNLPVTVNSFLKEQINMGFYNSCYVVVTRIN